MATVLGLDFKALHFPDNGNHPRRVWFRFIIVPLSLADDTHN